MSSVEQPLVTPDALRAFTQRLVALFSPERVILFGSLARGTSTWDSDADILVVMPFQGRAFDKAIEIRTRCRADFPIDLMVRSPQEVEQRYQWGDPFIREAIDQGILLHG